MQHQQIDWGSQYARLSGSLKGHIFIHHHEQHIWAELVSKRTGRKIVVFIPDDAKLDSCIRTGDYVEITGKILIRTSNQLPFHILAERVKPYEYKRIPNGNLSRIHDFLMDEDLLDEHTDFAKAA